MIIRLQRLRRGEPSWQMQTQTKTHTHTHTHTHIHKHTHPCAHTQTRTHLDPPTHTQTHTHKQTLSKNPLKFLQVNLKITVAVAARYFNGCSSTEIVGSNSTGGIDVCLLRVLCVVRQKFLQRVYHSSRGFYRLCCVVVCDLETSRMRSCTALGRSATGKKLENYYYL
jgi:hypothetical protein